VADVSSLFHILSGWKRRVEQKTVERDVRLAGAWLRAALSNEPQ
jgi:hypothetical protein